MLSEEFWDLIECTSSFLDECLLNIFETKLVSPKFLPRELLSISFLSFLDVTKLDFL